MAVSACDQRLELVIDLDSAWRIVCRRCGDSLVDGPFDTPDAQIDAGTRVAVAHRCSVPAHDGSFDLSAAAVALAVLPGHGSL